MKLLEDIITEFNDDLTKVEDFLKGRIFYACVYTPLRNVAPVRVTITSESFERRRLNALFFKVGNSENVLKTTFANLGLRSYDRNAALKLFDKKKDCEDYYIQTIRESFEKHRVMYTEGYFPEKNVEQKALLQKGLVQKTQDIEMMFGRKFFVSGFSPIQKIPAIYGSILRKNTEKIGPLTKIKAYTANCGSRKVYCPNLRVFEDENDARLYFNEEIFRQSNLIREFITGNNGAFDPVSFTNYLLEI